MTARTFELPQRVLATIKSLGAEPWLEGLAGMVADLEREWSMRAGRVLSGGSEALVAEAERADGTPAILKLLVPRGDGTAAHEMTALRLAAGEGCARVLEGDPGRGAMLLERLGGPLSASGIPEVEWPKIMAGAARRMWRPAQGYGLPTGVEKGRWLVEYITATWEQTGRPCSERAIDYALGCAERRIAAHDDERAVLVHGDIHANNTLQSPDGFKLVDPDGLLAEAEYDLGVIAREESLEGEEPRRLTRWLASQEGLDPEAAWEWSVAERISTGLLCTERGFQPFGRELLAAAERAAKE